MGRKLGHAATDHLCQSQRCAGSDLLSVGGENDT